MPTKELLVAQIGVTQLCDDDPRRTVIAITNLGTNAADFVAVSDDSKVQFHLFVLTDQYANVVLKASDGFDVKRPWYAWSSGADEWVVVFEEFEVERGK